MRIFLDANILFSAAKSDGAIRRLLALLTQRGHTLCIDPYVVEEARRNLIAKFPASVAQLDRLMPRAELMPIQVNIATQPAYGLPEKDRPILSAAIGGRCDVLVTGDKAHFAPLFGRTIEGVEVLSPAMLAEKILR